ADGTTYDALTFTGTQPVSTTGSGAIVLGGSGFNSVVVPTGTTLTVGAGVTIDGQAGHVGTGLFAASGPRTGGGLINKGPTKADGAGRPAPATPPGTVYVDAGTFTNEVSLAVSNGETLNLGRTDSTWSNTGTIGIASGTLNLGGTVSTSAL